MSYSGLMLDRVGTIRGICTLHSSDDLSATDAARDVLEQSTASAVEVWRQRHRIAKLYRSAPVGK